MKKISILAAMLAAAFCTSAFAQTQSGYFLDNYVYGYRLNPAIMSEKAFFGLGVGNIDLTGKSNLGLSDLLYKNPSGDGLVTGLNKSISAEEFLANIKDANNLGLNGGVNLISFGARKEHKMSTFEINVRANSAAYLPGDAFKFLKCGTENGGSYDLSSLNANMNAYLEIALGRAYENQKSNFTFGFRAKFLLGLAAADIAATKANLTINESQASADVLANGRLACSLGSFATDPDGNWTINFNQDPAAFRPAGYGGAVDLGIRWKPFKLLSITAGISDLGCMYWNYNSLAKAQGSYAFNGLEEVGPDTDVNAELDQMQKELLSVFNLSPVAGSESSFAMLPFTANAGARLRLPILSFISVGGLATYHYDPLAPWYDCRAGVTLTPFSWLSVSANTGKTSYGDVCGAALSFTFLFLNLFVSADAYQGPLGVYAIDGVDIPYFGGVPYPVDSFNYKVNVGLTMQLGKRYKVR